MQIFKYPHSTIQQILSLGAESAGNFSFFKNGQLFFSPDFGDLQEDANFKAFQKTVLAFLKKTSVTPDVIITDLHPDMNTTLWGKELAKKFKAEHVQVQHHVAHIFSQLGELTQDTRYKTQDTNKSQNSKLKTQNFFGIALDGTGYGLDEKIWGGEIFKITNLKFKISNERVGHLENQILLGGELAIQEPARMLIAILDKITSYKKQGTNKSQISNLKSQKNFIYNFAKKYYSAQEFEVLYKQLQQNFNCLETSSTGRILDAVSLLLGFCDNKRTYKHEAIDLLESNSGKPYMDIKPKIEVMESPSISNLQFTIYNEFSMTKFSKKHYILNTTYLFEYLIKNINKDKRRLAATAQRYIAEGLSEIIELQSKRCSPQIFIAGGIANNKIISEYFENKKTGSSSRIPVVQIPRGDAGLSFGQIIYFLTNSRD